ncbi:MULTISPECIES: hypothetical protein [unclassified Lentimonas]|uniref:type IV pilus modification PilV family protein n=1 Tax=unclassified Lentimonas TaxID=2630993 RepID=UPI0013222AB8|nr:MULTISPECIES: hypothetical protein [unclassified Lentimonas]CAA6676851.1 Unannotated [Lentimonas sp. CC4]CAA6686658.1 Unannotated [Lentimonas sp. CC6]CAA7075765.1 Unannotated [Lentimonas sp. CC4]CAA7168076.1 Unannotated [Lentimonas sp. CC21]CAA7181776.1 Unannotated [Lentimonas sp. CC8]
MNNRKQGSSLILVLIIATVIGVGIYSVIGLVSTEFRLNKKAIVYNEAKQAAESLLQSSMADLKSRFENQSAFPTDTLSPEKSPLYISSEFIQIHSDTDSLSHLTLPTKTVFTSESDFNTEPTEIIGGQIPPGEWRYIDPLVPGNEQDELKGTRVFERSIEMISKATAAQTQVGTSTVYARQFLQVRDAPLFAYAIFYNVPLEIAPGAQMEIHGPVHANTSTWLQSSDSLDFYSKLTIAGDLSHGRHPDATGGTSNGDITITNSSGVQTSLQTTDGWMETGVDDFVDLTNQAFGGNLQTSEHGVSAQNPVGVNDYIEDTDSSTDQKESYNSAYNLIQPILNESELAYPSATDDPEGYAEATRLNEIEKQKYAYKAGLIIRVDSSGNISYRAARRDSDDTILYYDNGKQSTRRLEPTTDIATYKPFTEDDGTITSGMYDARLGEDLDMIEIDVGALKDLVDKNDAADWDDTGSDDSQPEEWWNGIVYVDFPEQNSSSDRDDNVNPAIEGWGVKLVNAETIPNPSFAQDDNIYGMSLATNQMLYVQGNYNADGDLDTGSPTEADNSNFGAVDEEAPAALIADSITFLSVDWDDADSNKGKKDHRVAGDTEVSAAILTGLVPSGESGSNSYSGGLENFPRFLEKWSNKTFLIRGSIVALFESEVGTAPWAGGEVYSPPNRAWGFHEKFGEGYLPPGTPNTRQYRAVDFEIINKDTYEEYVQRIKTYY